MKSTMVMRPIANPRRTTLAHLQDTGDLGRGTVPRPAPRELPAHTANPRRTILTDRDAVLSLP